jgi:hypothetical protein
MPVKSVEAQQPAGPWPPKVEENLKEPAVFAGWNHKCGACANYSGSQNTAGYCRVWGAVMAPSTSLARPCPHWSSREALSGAHCQLRPEVI